MIDERCVSTVTFAVMPGRKKPPTKLAFASTNQKWYCQTLDSMEQ